LRFLILIFTGKKTQIVYIIQKQKFLFQIIIKQFNKISQIGMYVVESSNVTQIEVCHSSTHGLAFSLNWHRSVVEQGSFDNVHLSLCWIVSSSAQHWQVVFAVEVAKPHFFSSVIVLATPVRRRLRHRHVVYPEFDPGGNPSSGAMLKCVPHTYIQQIGWKYPSLRNRKTPFFA